MRALACNQKVFRELRLLLNLVEKVKFLLRLEMFLHLWRQTPLVLEAGKEHPSNYTSNAEMTVLSNNLRISLILSNQEKFSLSCIQSAPTLTALF